MTDKMYGPLHGPVTPFQEHRRLLNALFWTAMFQPQGKPSWLANGGDYYARFSGLRAFSEEDGMPLTERDANMLAISGLVMVADWMAGQSRLGTVQALWQRAALAESCVVQPLGLTLARHVLFEDTTALSNMQTLQELDQVEAVLQFGHIVETAQPFVSALAACVVMEGHTPYSFDYLRYVKELGASPIV